MYNVYRLQLFLCTPSLGSEERNVYNVYRLQLFLCPPYWGVKSEMCTMCTVYSFPREGVGQQNVYSLCTVYSFFSGRYLANLRGKARGGE